MFRAPETSGISQIDFLHVRGDVPHTGEGEVLQRVFSTYVEMFLAARVRYYAADSFLHVRGDIPIRMVDISELIAGLSARERRYLHLHGFTLQQ